MALFDDERMFAVCDDSKPLVVRVRTPSEDNAWMVRHARLAF